MLIVAFPSDPSQHQRPYESRPKERERRSDESSRGRQKIHLPGDHCQVSVSCIELLVRGRLIESERSLSIGL